MKRFLGGSKLFIEPKATFRVQALVSEPVSATAIVTDVALTHVFGDSAVATRRLGELKERFIGLSLRSWWKAPTVPP